MHGTTGWPRVLERRRAVALARHYRDFEGLSIRQIADRLGRSPATIKAYFYDPTGEKARAVKEGYVGVCRGCGGATEVDAGAGNLGDAGVARALRPAADYLRLVADARASAWGRGARATPTR